MGTSHGESGLLAISYPELTFLKSSSKTETIADCLQTIESALTQKILKLEYSVSPIELPELSHKVEKQCKERAAELLLQMINNSVKFSKSLFQTTASLKSLKSFKTIIFTRSADVVSWFPSGDGSEYMQLIGLWVICGGARLTTDRFRRSIVSDKDL